MKRDLPELSSTIFDVLVIGGGIHGAAVAREASRQGFKTALIEMNDFGHATSFNSMKVIHGGLRYLQHGNLKRVRQSVRSRKIMQRVAPHLVKSVPFLVPTYGSGIKSKWIMRLAFLINDLMSFDRNLNLDPLYHIKGGKVISKKEILNIIPGINGFKLTGGAVWYEAVIQNTERLLLEFLLDAYNYDFAAANYVEAAEYIIRDGNVKGVYAKDLLNSQEFSIQAKVVVNTAGPWFNSVQRSLNINIKPKIKLTKAVNIIINKKIFFPYAVGLEGKQVFSDTDALIKRGKRLLFFVPIENYTMIGTTYKLYERDIKELQITRKDIIEIIDEVNYLYPSLNLSFDDVSFYHIGLLPMDEKSVDDNVQAERHSDIYDYEKKFNIKNLISVKSVKYTTAPVVAEAVVGKIRKKIKPVSKKGKINSSAPETEKTDIPGNIRKYLKSKYGVHSNKILNIINENRSNLNFISDDPPVIVAEIIHAVKNEMAFTLKDVILRRTGMGTLKSPSSECIAASAEIMAAEFGWNDSRRAAEIEDLLKVYDRY